MPSGASRGHRRAGALRSDQTQPMPAHLDRRRGRALRTVPHDARRGSTVAGGPRRRDRSRVQVGSPRGSTRASCRVCHGRARGPGVRGAGLGREAQAGTCRDQRARRLRRARAEPRGRGRDVRDRGHRAAAGVGCAVLGARCLPQPDRDPRCRHQGGDARHALRRCRATAGAGRARPQLCDRALRRRHALAARPPRSLRAGRAHRARQPPAAVRVPPRAEIQGLAPDGRGRVLPVGPA